MAAVERCGNRCDFIREKAQAEFGVALLDHPAQHTGRADAPLGPVNGTAVATDFFLMACCTLMRGDQLFAQPDVGAVKNLGVLGQGRHGPVQGCKQQQGKQAFHGLSCSMSK